MNRDEGGLHPMPGGRRPAEGQRQTGWARSGATDVTPFFREAESFGGQYQLPDEIGA